ncbi:DUF5801 repeats-in-toxin domain-containing protein, partial [Halomonas alimentaria]
DSATSDAALSITFKDDGPDASAEEGASASATLDETDAGEAFIDGPIDTTITAANVAALFAAPAYGADGAGTVSYSLTATNTATGLYLAGADTDVATNEIQLVADTDADGNVIGYTGYVGGDDTTDPVFSVEVASDGTITVTHHQALEHLVDGDNSEGEHDDALTLDAAGIRVVQTVIDADGDSDSATSDAALEITFSDDGPTAENYAHDGAIEEGSEATVLAEDAAEALGINAGADGLDGSFSDIVFTNQGDTEGSLSINGDGQLVYTAPASVDNTDGDVTETFEYTVLDQDGDRVTRQVTVRVGDAHTPTIDNPEGDEVVALVDDDGLAGGNPGGPNDLDGQGGDETTFSGTLAFAYGDDGAGHVDFAAMDGESGTLGTEDITYAWDADNNVLTATIDGGERDGQDLFQVELTDAQTGDYTVSLLNNVLHTDDETDTENETDLGLTYTVTDSDGSTADGKLNITFDDDVPVSNADSQDMTVVVNALEVGGLTAGWSNVSGGSGVNIDNQPAGQDDVVSWDGTSSTSNYTFDDNDDLTGTQSVSVNSMFELGEFTHNNFPISSGSGIDSVDLNLSLDVTINGYNATIDHTINFDHNETPNSGSDPRDIVTINNASAIVPIEITTESGEVETYNFQIIGFVDQNGDVVDQVFTDEGASNSFKLMGQLVSSDAPDVSGQVDYGFGADGPAEDDAVVWNGGTDNGNGETLIQGQFGVLTVDADGNYTYQLDQSAYDELAAGETEVDTFTYTVTDADGDSVESSLDINITGEAAPQKPNLVPESEDESVELEVGDVATDLVLTLDVSGSMDEDVGGTGKTRFEIAKESLISTIESYQQMGDTNVNLTLFGSNAINVGWKSASDAVDYIESLELHWRDYGYNDGVYASGSDVGVYVGGTDYKDAIDETEGVDFAGRDVDQTVGYFLSDGEPNENEWAVNSDNGQTIQDWKNFIDANVDELHVIGIGSDVSDEYLEHVQVQEGKDPLIVTDESQLEQTLTNTAQVSVSGDVSDNVSGGDGAISFDSITAYGTTYTVDGSNGTTAFPSDGIPLDGQGTLMFDFSTGEYTYSAGATEFEEGLTQKQFSVTASDEDGDSTSFDVNIDVTAPDMAASEPQLEGELVMPPTVTTTSETETFNEDGSVFLRGGGSNSSHAYNLDGTATGFSLEVSDYQWWRDDGTIKLYKDGGQVGSTINMDYIDLAYGTGWGYGELSYSGGDEFDTVVVERTDGRFDISDFSAEVTKEVTTYEYGLNLSASLTDTDGSETLSDITIDGLPSGALVTGTGVTGNSDGSYTVALDTNGEAAGDVRLVSSSELNQSQQEAITLSVTSTESNGGDTNTVTGTLDAVVVGTSSDDSLTGTDGNDTLYGGAGNDDLYGGLGADTFAWEFGDEGDVGAPAEDTVQDFTVVSDTDDGQFGDTDEPDADRLDLADLLQGEDEDSIGDYIFAEEEGDNVVLHISSDGSLNGGSSKENADQTITLEGKSFADFGGDVSDSAGLIQQMIDSGQLNIDQ